MKKNDLVKIEMRITLKGTEALAYKLASRLSEGDCLCLSGDLGAGKTTFSQFFCRALGVDDYVTSPTFNIMNQYEGQYPIYHFDVYRIADEDEMYEIGFEEFLYGKGICLIEWAGLIENLIPEDAIWMTLTLAGPETREVTIVGPREKIGGIDNETS
jgi:tRNA threonylcarbamoyladenosine biosynthesis protein TsaE